MVLLGWLSVVGKLTGYYPVDLLIEGLDALYRLLTEAGAIKLLFRKAIFRNRMGA